MRQQGFTLLELLAVLVVISIAMTLLTTGISRGLAGVRERQVLDDMLQTLRQAHVLAVTKGQSMTLRFDLHRLCYRLEQRAEKCLPAGYQLTVQSAAELPRGEPTFVFHADGSASGGNIRVHTPTHMARVDVSWLTGIATLVQQ